MKGYSRHVLGAIVTDTRLKNAGFKGALAVAFNRKIIQCIVMNMGTF